MNNDEVLLFIVNKIFIKYLFFVVIFFNKLFNYYCQYKFIKIVILFRLINIVSKNIKNEFN